MRVYFEYRNSCNNKAIPLALLDKIVAKFFDDVPDEKKYYMPSGDTLSWTEVIQGLLWTNDLVRWHDRVEMDELVQQLVENGSLYQPDDTQAYVDLLHYFQHLNLYLYVVFLDQSVFDPYDKNASYMTTAPDMKYTEEEVDRILKFVVSRKTFVQEYGIRELLPLSQGIVPESFDAFMCKVESQVVKDIKEFLEMRPLEMEEMEELLHNGFPLNLTHLSYPQLFSDYMYRHRSGNDFYKLREKMYELHDEKQKQRQLEIRFNHCNSETEIDELRNEVASDLLEKCKSMIPMKFIDTRWYEYERLNQKEQIIWLKNYDGPFKKEANAILKENEWRIEWD